MTRRAVAVFAVAAVAAISWAVATPLFASPDEPAHVIKAAGVARGQLIGEEPGAGAAFGARTMQLPAILASAHEVACFAQQPSVPANCFEFTGPTTTDDVATTAGRHPPFYYAIVGLPSLIDAGSGGVYVMRIVSALVTGTFLAAAWVLLGQSRHPATARLGLAVAASPMLLFLGGVVNPSAWEIAAAILLWSSGFALMRGPITPLGIHAAGAAAVTLALARQLGPLWLVLILAVLGVLAGDSMPRELWRRPLARVWAAATGVAVAAQALWIIIVQPLDTAGITDDRVGEFGTLQLIRNAFGRMSIHYSEMLGVFGWRDTAPPEWTPIVWTAAVFGLALAGIALGRRTEVLLILLIALVTLAIPVAAEVRAARDTGFFWQGRYSLPLAVGIPMVAAWITARTVTIRPRVLATIGLALASAQFLAYGQALRRYASGARSDELLYWTDAAWTPPVPILVCLGVFTASIAAWYWFLLANDPTPGGVTTHDATHHDWATSDGRSELAEGSRTARGAP